MSYTQLFDPKAEVALASDYSIPDLEGDARDGAHYVYSNEITLGVNVALATGRPLLVRGAPGSGKSSLAPSVSRKLGWRYYEHVVTSRTDARDLLWTFDAVRRLSDAHANAARDTVDYIEPGRLWWAFDAKSASYRGLKPSDRAGVKRLPDPSPRKSDRAVVLIDEIDKADPDVPNNLLVALGSRRFTVTDTGAEVGCEHVPLVIITTNNERALPAAFLRRCLTLSLPDPKPARLKAIGREHLGDKVSAAILNAAAKKFEELGKEARSRRIREPSTAEFLDLLWACNKLQIRSRRDRRWQDVSNATLWKHHKPPGEAPGEEIDVSGLGEG